MNDMGMYVLASILAAFGVALVAFGVFGDERGMPARMDWGETMLVIGIVAMPNTARQAIALLVGCWSLVLLCQHLRQPQPRFFVPEWVLGIAALITAFWLGGTA